MAKKPTTKKDKEMMTKEAGLTAAQKKLPPALQAAMLKKMKKK
jgi:hypothetical protein